MAELPAPVAELLTELDRHGIELQAHGNRLRYRPRSALAPELAQRVRAHKAALLALLRHGRPPQPPQNGQKRPTAAATPRAGEIGRPNTPACEKPCDAPHELSLAERVESGYVNRGWTPTDWADRLRQLAARCEATRSELARLYRTWAANVEKNEEGLA